jgi:hypothetical protein
MACDVAQLEPAAEPGVGRYWPQVGHPIKNSGTSSSIHFDIRLSNATTPTGLTSILAGRPGITRGATVT